MGEVVGDGIILLVYEFILIIIYIVLSDPVAIIINSIANAGTSMGVTQMTFYQQLINHTFDLVIVLAAFVPIVWFIVRMWSREPDWGYRYY
jgi:hypothetical protein